MSSEPPPNPQVSTFNPAFWNITADNGITTQFLDANYLKFPFSQSAVETFVVSPQCSATQPAPTDNSTKIPTTAWVQSAIGAGSIPNLQGVLNLGNTATGANAKIGLTDSGVGGIANPQLQLQNSNATAGNTNGVPTMEYYKSGRNVVANDVIASQRFNANNYLGTKTAFGRIDCLATNTGAGNDDGALDFYTCVNGTSSLVFRMNGADNENNSFRPLDMNGNAIKTSSGDLSIDTTASTGTGNITIAGKAGGITNITATTIGITASSILNMSATGAGAYMTATINDDITLTSTAGDILLSANSGAIKTDNTITTLTGAGGSVIDFAGGNPDNRFDIDKGEVRLHWNNLTDQADISLTNDYASANSVIDMVYQSPVGNLQTILQNIPSIQTFKQVDSINGRTSEIRTDKIELGNSSSTTALINNNLGSDQNELLLSATNSFSSLSTQARVLNTPTSQAFNLVNSAGTSNTKTLSLSNATSGAGSLTYSNAIDGNPFNITTNQDLNISSTKVGGSTQLSSPNGVEVRGDNSVVLNATNNAGGSITLSCNTTGSLNLNGTALQSNSAGGNSGEHLVIVLNGTTYKIKLENP
jgi:hypothetical protein